MRFAVMIKSDDATEAGQPPDERFMAAMGAYNEELVEAGVMLSGEGFQASSKGARVALGGGEPAVVTPGPFGPANELVAGFWIFETASLDEAIAWAKRCPLPEGVRGELEIRQLFEASDFA